MRKGKGVRKGDYFSYYFVPQQRERTLVYSLMVLCMGCWGESAAKSSPREDQRGTERPGVWPVE